MGELCNVIADVDKSVAFCICKQNRHHLQLHKCNCGAEWDEKDHPKLGIWEEE